MRCLCWYVALHFWVNGAGCFFLDTLTLENEMARLSQNAGA